MIRRRYLRNRARGNIVYPGLIAAWSAAGKTNDDEDRAILKDLTANGHDITLNGFAFSEMSGYGGYVYDLIKSQYSTISNNVVTIISNEGAQYASLITSPSSIVGEKGKTLIYTRKAFDIKISNLPDGVGILINVNKNNGNKSEWEYIGQFVNGIYHIDERVFTVEPYNSASTPYVTDCRILFSTKLASVKNIADLGITIELLPEYPDALVFDGVDDYGVNENVPILTDFTVIAKRKTFKDETSEQKSPFISKMLMMGTGAFAIEGAWIYNNVINFGTNNTINYIDNDITFVTKNNYNEQSIISGSFVDNQGICIGIMRPSHTVRWKGAIYSVYLFDRSLDKQEIKAFIRKYIDANYVLPSEQTT